MVGKRDTLENRLWAKIDKRSENECWPWSACKNNKGYGQIKVSKEIGKRLSHRLVFSFVNGEIPEGLVVMHSCDNPACCNPLHLSLGTMKDNHKDMVSKGRRVIAWNPDNKPPINLGENHWKAKLTEEQAREIKFSKRPTKELVLEYGVGRDVIKRIRSGRGWKHL